MMKNNLTLLHEIDLTDFPDVLDLLPVELRVSLIFMARYAHHYQPIEMRLAKGDMRILKKTFEGAGYASQRGFFVGPTALVVPEPRRKVQ